MNIETKLDTKISQSSKTEKPLDSPKPFVVEELVPEERFKDLVTSFFQENQELIQEWLDQNEPEAVELPLPAPTSFSQIITSPAAIQSTAEVVEVFEEIVSQIQIAHNVGDTKTTFYLDSPQFSHSLFYGSQIVVEEFRTSPKTFNVTLIAKPEAAALFRNHLSVLTERFQQGQQNLPFSIHRLEVHLIEEKEHDKRDNQEEEQE